MSKATYNVTGNTFQFKDKIKEDKTMNKLTEKLISKTGSIEAAEKHIDDLFNHMADDERFAIEGEDLDGMVCALIETSGEKRTFELLFKS